MMTAAAPGRIELDVLASRPLIATAEACHADTVMDLSVTGDVVATIDFAGNWAVWHCRDLRRIGGGSVAGRVGRRVAIAPDGRRLAVLTGTEGVDYDWQPAIIDIATGVVAPFGRAGVKQIAWTDAGLIAMGPRGYRLHDPAGRVLVDGHHPPEPGSAWMGSAATRDGTRMKIDAQLELVSRRVRTVAPGGMAERAGLMVGDEIMAVDGISVAELGAASTLALITQRPSGSVSKLSIVRGTETRGVAVTVRSEP